MSPGKNIKVTQKQVELFKYKVKKIFTSVEISVRVLQKVKVKLDVGGWCFKLELILDNVLILYVD